MLPPLVPPSGSVLISFLCSPGRTRALPRGAPPLSAAPPPRGTTGQCLVRRRTDWRRPPLGGLRVVRVSTSFSMATWASSPHTGTCQQHASGLAVSPPQPSLPPHPGRCSMLMGWPGRPVSSRRKTQMGCCWPTQQGTRGRDHSRPEALRVRSHGCSIVHKGPTRHVCAGGGITVLRGARPKGGGPGP